MLNGVSRLKYQLNYFTTCRFFHRPSWFPKLSKDCYQDRNLNFFDRLPDNPSRGYYQNIPQSYYLFINYSFKHIHTIKVYKIAGSIYLLSFVKMSTTMHTITNATLVLLFYLISTKYSYLCIDNIFIF